MICTKSMKDTISPQEKLKLNPLQWNVQSKAFLLYYKQHSIKLTLFFSPCQSCVLLLSIELLINHVCPIHNCIQYKSVYRMSRHNFNNNTTYCIPIAFCATPSTITGRKLVALRLNQYFFHACNIHYQSIPFL